MGHPVHACAYQAVEEVHHDNDDEEDEGEKEEVPDGRLDRQVSELQLAHEHGERLHDREVEGVEEGVVVGSVLCWCDSNVKSHLSLFMFKPL